MEGTLTGQDNDLLRSQFWEKWTEYQDQLYRCCLKFMNSNPTDAEDALSQAMLKAWEKVQKYAGKIDNLKAWLFKLTSNLCIDIIRKRSRGAVGVESIEWVGDTEEIGIGSTVASPEICLERQEQSTEIQQAIANLPETLRETFILHFYQELTHTEIAQRQGISYDNVCRRIYQARKLLKEKLSGYFRGAEEDVISSPVEYLGIGGKKAEGSSAKPLPQAGQKAEGKEESCKLDSHELSFTTKEENSGVPASPCLRVPASPCFPVSASVLTKGIQEDMILVGDGDSNGQNKIGIKEVIVETSPTVRETGTVSVETCNPNRLTIKGEPQQQSPIYPFRLCGICLQWVNASLRNRRSQRLPTPQPNSLKINRKNQKKRELPSLKQNSKTKTKGLGFGNFEDFLLRVFLA
ncbi:RNA polymerase sigma factor [Okeania sp. KiyG1]|uniref:RNA polymerase sigma factor n=1 Tax=Okeania sp. KiyG1 TaxID=2720165 RepID=UPI001921DBA5|nr:sigma-70 family RNA polymerase sigma factor [Okeania sp. KiyG1]GFZ90299.1 hypothetical protein CYANOKiyG1_00600 [Okeania sp. KiyG1]